MTQTETIATPAKESFAELLDQSFEEMTSIEGSVVSGTVISIEKDMILIAIGFQMEIIFIFLQIEWEPAMTIFIL